MVSCFIKPHDLEVPPCTRCGEALVFELQLLPTLLNHIQVDDGMEYGSVVVYTCPTCSNEPHADEGTFINNRAVSGGAIHSITAMSITNSTFLMNAAIANLVIFTVDGSSGGGAIYIGTPTDGNNVYAPVNLPQTITILGSSFVRNHADDAGGAIHSVTLWVRTYDYVW